MSGQFGEREVGLYTPTWLLSAKSMWPLASFRAVAKRSRNATGQKLQPFGPTFYADATVLNRDEFFTFLYKEIYLLQLICMDFIVLNE